MARFSAPSLNQSLAILLISITTAGVFSQEKSMRPGINDAFVDPDVEAFIGRFEVESREVYLRRKEIVAECKISPGSVIADIGCGTGLFTRLFAEAIGKEGRVMAVDISEKFLNHVRKTCRENGFANVDTVRCTPESTELAPETVDIAFVCDTYHHFEYPEKTMLSLHRALKPSGKVVLVDFRRVEGESSNWTLEHVRAGQEVFESEIESAGFKKVSSSKIELKENYLVIFEKK